MRRWCNGKHDGLLNRKMWVQIPLGVPPILLKGLFMNCYFKVQLKRELILCMLYSRFEYNGLHWANYPDCNKENCPLLHPELLGNMIWENN